MLPCYTTVLRATVLRCTVLLGAVLSTTVLHADTLRATLLRAIVLRATCYVQPCNVLQCYMLPCYVLVARSTAHRLANTSTACKPLVHRFLAFFWHFKIVFWHFFAVLYLKNGQLIIINSINLQDDSFLCPHQDATLTGTQLLP